MKVRIQIGIFIFMATKFTKLPELPIKPNVDLTNDYVPVNNGTSTYNLQMQKIIDAAREAAMLNTDNVCALMYSGGFPLVIKPNKISSYSSYFPVGVIVNYGVDNVVIALEESATKLPLSSGTSIVSGGTKTPYRSNAVADMGGKTNANAMLQNSDYQGANTAVGFCNSYSRVSVSNSSNGLRAGKWFLPSVGQFMQAIFNLEKVNYVISLLGGTPIKLTAEDSYLLSTQATDTEEWVYFVGNGNLGYMSKTNTTHWVRPFSIYQ